MHEVSKTGGMQKSSLILHVHARVFLVMFLISFERANQKGWREARDKNNVLSGLTCAKGLDPTRDFHFLQLQTIIPILLDV